MNDKAVIAACIGAILAAMLGGFTYIWHHIESNAMRVRQDRVYKDEVIRPTLIDHEGRLRSIEKCDPECD